MMRALIWKDLRLNQAVFVFAAIVLILPYACFTLLHFYWQASDQTSPGAGLGMVLTAAFIGFALTSIVACGAAGNAMACERTNHSAEFAAYLPVSRTPVMISKLMIAVLLIGVMWGVNLAVFLIALGATDATIGQIKKQQAEPIIVSFATAICLFGTSWLGSSFMRTPSRAAIFGLVLWMAVLLAMISYMAITIVDKTDEGAKVAAYYLYVSLCLGLGVAAVITGSVIYVRRVRP